MTVIEKIEIRGLLPSPLTTPDTKGVSLDVHYGLKDAERIEEIYFPISRVFSGSATLSEMADTIPDYSPGHLRAHAAACRKLSQDASRQPTSRLDNISLLARNIGLEARASDIDHPFFHRSVYSLGVYFDPFSAIDSVRTKLHTYDIPVSAKQLILRRRIIRMFRDYPNELDHLIDYLLSPPSEGLTEKEQTDALHNLVNLLSSEDGKRLHQKAKEFWEEDFTKDDGNIIRDEKEILSVEGFRQDVEDANVDLVVNDFRSKLTALGFRIKNHTPQRDASWGVPAVKQHFESLLIPHEPEEILAFVQNRLSQLTLTINNVSSELAQRMGIKATDWSALWKKLPYQDRLEEMKLSYKRSIDQGETEVPQESAVNETDEAILEYYRARIPDVLKKMQNAGLIPDWPANFSYELKMPEETWARFYPKGYIAFPGYHDPEMVAKLFLPLPSAFSEETRDDILRELVLGVDLYAAHEVGAHATQAAFKTNIPEHLTTVHSLAILGQEGHAFSTELDALEIGVIEPTLLNLYMVLRGRLQRTARAVFELKYHLKKEPDFEKLITEFAQNMGSSIDFARSDATRGIEKFGELLAYYFGASGADNYVQLALSKDSNLSREKILQRWLESNGAHIPPHLQAYLDGYIDDPSDFKWFISESSDRAVMLWQDASFRSRLS